jgi:hypothetical protein
MLISETIHKALRAINAGDFSVHLDESIFQSTDEKEIAREINELVAHQRYLLEEHSRLQEAAERGQLDTRARASHNASGAWLSYINAINKYADATVAPVKEIINLVEHARLGNLDVTSVQQRNLEGEYLKAYESIRGLMTMLYHFTNEIDSVTANIKLGRMGMHNVRT